MLDNDYHECREGSFKIVLLEKDFFVYMAIEGNEAEWISVTSLVYAQE